MARISTKGAFGAHKPHPRPAPAQVQFATAEAGPRLACNIEDEKRVDGAGFFSDKSWPFSKRVMAGLAGMWAR